jgi:hypothetical protein
MAFFLYLALVFIVLGIIIVAVAIIRRRFRKAGKRHP